MKPTKTQATRTEIPFQVDLLDLHVMRPQRYPFFLESAIDQAPLGRYDILFAFPGESLRLDANLTLHGSMEYREQGFLASLDRWWSQLKQTRAADVDLPFVGGWFVFLGYELAQEIEPSLHLATEPGLPVAVATRIPIAVIRDRLRATAWIIAEPGSASAVKEVEADLAELKVCDDSFAPILSGSVTEEPPERFLGAVDAAKAHITAGDVFQANLSRKWTALLTPGVQPAAVYRRLRRSNPAPFAGLAVYDEFAIISSSPERLLRSRAGRVETRPIAGTRPRDEAAKSDESRRVELLAHPKERAEHVMLIDLERNDLGRICKPGSVKVDEFRVVESYSHVHHIVSNVGGQLLDSATPGNMIRAVFPGGTITGCPKVRCMQIIHELEAHPRSAYTGAMGYISRDGSSDFNILIRTIITVNRDLSFATGSGIVADSDPFQELEETRAKAKGLLLALQPDRSD
jgi:anthranilate synthase component 1